MGLCVGFVAGLTGYLLADKVIIYLVRICLIFTNKLVNDLLKLAWKISSHVSMLKCINLYLTHYSERASERWLLVHLHLTLSPIQQSCSRWHLEKNLECSLCWKKRIFFKLESFGNIVAKEEIAPADVKTSIYGVKG